MSWIASGVALAAGVGSSMMNDSHAKKMAAKQAKLSREQAEKLRLHAEDASRASESEIDTLRNLRSLDLPAFKQASETAMIQAQKGAERMSRHRMMSRSSADVRHAIFGGQFQQYVGREAQRIGQHAQLTQQILQATDKQQQMALQVESQASGVELSGQMSAIQTEMEAGDLGANILGAVGSAASAYAASLPAGGGDPDVELAGDTYAANLEGPPSNPGFEYRAPGDVVPPKTKVDWWNTGGLAPGGQGGWA